MNPSLTTIVLALVSFAVTFVVARTLAKWWKKRRPPGRDESVEGRSRQVRRAQQRRKSSR